MSPKSCELSLILLPLTSHVQSITGSCQFSPDNILNIHCFSPSLCRPVPNLQHHLPPTNTCWGSSSRRRDRQWTVKLDLGNWRLLSPSPVLEMCIHLPSPLPKAVPRIQPGESNVILRLYVTESSEGLSIKTFKMLAGGWVRKTTHPVAI